MEALKISTPDGHQFELLAEVSQATRTLLYWAPALGVPARKYQRFAESLAKRGIGLIAHEWRGQDSSSMRASRSCDWSYRQLFIDFDAGLAEVRRRYPRLPIWMGGHSLGAQLAMLQSARDSSLEGTVIVAGGAPYWRTFSGLSRLKLLTVFIGFRALGALVGHYPGEAIGFAGREARGVMRDWARSGMNGVYRPAGMETDLEAALTELRRPIIALHLQNDSLVPKASLAYLLAKSPEAPVLRADLTPADFSSGKADHFSWMRDLEPVSERLAQHLISPLRRTG